MNTSEKLLTGWQRQSDVKPNLGVDPAVMDEVRACGWYISGDFYEYLSKINGFSTKSCDDSFCGLDENSFEFHALISSSDVSPNGFFRFCTWQFGAKDYLIDFHRESCGRVVGMLDEREGQLIANSFSEFVDLYISNDDWLYSWRGELVMLNP